MSDEVEIIERVSIEPGSHWIGLDDDDYGSLLPSRFRLVRIQFGAPTVTAVFHVRQGMVPVCTTLIVQAAPDDGDVVTSGLVAGLRLGDMGRVALAGLVRYDYGPRYGKGSDPFEHGEPHTAAEAFGERAEVMGRKAVGAVRNATQGRPRITDTELRQVAETYRQHVNSRPVEAVGVAFGLAPRTAARRVQECRRRGFLPPTTPGKVRA